MGRPRWARGRASESSEGRMMRRGGGAGCEGEVGGGA